MSSTEFTVGLKNSRSSSKVLKPPGGGSSDIFGTGSGSTQPSVENAQPSMDNAQPSVDNAQPSVDNAQLSVDNKPKDSSTKNRLFGSESLNANVRSTPQRNTSNIFTGETQASSSRKKQYVRRNPITGEGFETPDNEEPATNENEERLEDNARENQAVHAESAPARNVTTSIRVRNPPGGKSSGIF